MLFRKSIGARTLALAAPILSCAAMCNAAGVIFPVSSGGTGNAYEVFVDPSANITSAESAAAAAGGHLATITSSAEQTFVESLLTNANVPTGSYFFGLERIGAQAFAWDSGEPFNYNHFAPGEPNDYQSSESAGQIYWSQTLSDDLNHRRGGWNDAPADGYASTDIADLVRTGYIIERAPAAGDTVGASPTKGGSKEGNGSGNGSSGPIAIPLPAAVLAAPLGAIVAGFAARRRRHA